MVINMRVVVLVPQGVAMLWVLPWFSALVTTAHWLTQGVFHPSQGNRRNSLSTGHDRVYKFLPAFLLLHREIL